MSLLPDVCADDDVFSWNKVITDIQKMPFFHNFKHYIPMPSQMPIFKLFGQNDHFQTYIGGRKAVFIGWCFEISADWECPSGSAFIRLPYITA
jgi:hypothetical protein